MEAKQLETIISTVEQAVNELKENQMAKDSITSFAEVFYPFASGGTELLKDSKILKIGVVGQVKAGKSSFLNSVMFNGDDILPKASTPMTAGLTVLEYAETPQDQRFEVAYYSQKDWNIFEEANKSYERIADEVKKEMGNEAKTLIDKVIKERTTSNQQAAHELVSMCKSSARNKIGKGNDSTKFSNVKDLQRILADYVGANGDYTPVVKSLTIYLNDPRLKDVRIVDTPGVNDPVVSREELTKKFLSSCHGVFFLSSSSRFLDAQDVRFMNDRVADQGIGTILLLASKYDSVLQDLGLQYRGKPQEGDLEYADESAQKSLQRTFDSKKSEITSNIDKIKWDTTSGIGFSIAKKDKAALDAVEKNVLEQMQRFYPDAFVHSDYRETFEMLSNIATIRDEYLEKDFKEKKDEIIFKKVNAFFSQNVKELREKAEELKKNLEDRLKKIQTSNIDQIKKQKADLKNIFKTTEDELKNIISAFQNSLDRKIKDLKNIDRPSAEKLLKLMDTEFDLECKVWYGHKTVQRIAKYLNTLATKSEINDAVKKYIEQWENDWSNNFAEQKKELFKKYAEVIGEFAKNTTDQAFENDVRLIMEKVLDDIEINKTLGLTDLRDNFLNAIYDYIDSSYNVSKYYDKYRDKNEERLQGLLNEDVSKEMSTVRSSLQNRFNNLPGDIEASAQTNKNEANAKLEGIKNNIASKLQSGSEQYFQKFEEEIKNVEKVIPEYEKAIAQAEIIIKALK